MRSPSLFAPRRFSFLSLLHPTRQAFARGAEVAILALRRNASALRLAALLILGFLLALYLDTRSVPADDFAPAAPSTGAAPFSGYAAPIPPTPSAPAHRLPGDSGQ